MHPDLRTAEERTCFRMIEEIHQVIGRLEEKVRPLVIDSDLVDAKNPRPMRSPINDGLQGIMDRLATLVDKIEN